MNSQNSKFIVTFLFRMLQFILLMWFLVRGGIGIVMLILDWKQSYEPVQVLFTLLFQLFWVGLLPILLLNAVRKFVLNLIENRLFTEETYQLSK
ncbi:hypothetical protein J2T50_000628 [Streptococcus gallinaceus]|uniref:hypothetical protein n=1 Tax=Streptococcus gallinaceus TaxID=165758 RepID=UPI00209C8880|nr:hypothetical protein [Streptococcus gallinaceus]MCP1638933.1 hypothetical protein [Streptococcus gallinaceus]MCP1769823.1 hypothetical protein [Streptococcus gallinaceus]